MKILFLSRSLESGGAERQLAVLASGLSRIGWKVVIASFYYEENVDSKLERDGVSIRYLYKKGRWDVVGFAFRLIKLIREEAPDIIHGYLPVPNIIAVLLRPLLPAHKLVWGIRASNMEMDQYDWLTRWSYRLERNLSGFPDMIIANSQAGMEVMREKGFSIDKALMIPNGIDTQRFHPDSAGRVAMREQFGIAAGDKLIGLVARLDPMKDHLTFMRAAAYLINQRENMRFICVGDGPDSYRQKLMAVSMDLGIADRLVWADTVEDMAAMYNAFDVATLSSAYGEGFPNVIGEAMACGVPCVVTNVGDSAYIIGDTGIVVPTRNPEALALAWDTMLDRIDKEGCELGVRARERLCRLFGDDALIKQSQQAFQRLM
jgi:glycosyltransferase involved in cell wall biosynthesis